jgi:hypothetical protein
MLKTKLVVSSKGCSVIIDGYQWRHEQKTDESADSKAASHLVTDIFNLHDDAVIVSNAN